MNARSLFTRIFSRAPASETPGGVLRRSGAGSTGQDFLRGLDLSPTICDNPFGQVAFVYRAVCAIAEQVATVPFRFAARAEGRDRITEGRLREFYERPHPRLSGFEFWELRVMWLLLRGECMRVPVYEYHNGRKRLDRVMMLDPEQFKHQVDDGKLVGWRYLARGPGDPMESQVLLPEEVWYERLPNPFDPWRGMAPLQVAMAPAASEFAATHWMRAVMENNGDAGVIVRTQEPLDEGQREQFLAALRERKRGIGRADRPLLLWGGAEIVAAHGGGGRSGSPQPSEILAGGDLRGIWRAGRSDLEPERGEIRRHARGAAQFHRESRRAVLPAARGRGTGVCPGDRPAGAGLFRGGRAPGAGGGAAGPAENGACRIPNGRAVQRTESRARSGI